MQYGDYAAIYDHSGQVRFSVLMDLYLRDLLRDHPVTGRHMLDLACGTGTLALLMAERGWRVIGLDQSAAMLDEAARKLAALDPPPPVTFVQGDMRNVFVQPPVDLITCCYDTLNYLTLEADLAQCFGAAARSLTPGGLFCFDLATDYFLRTHWQGVEYEEADSFAQLMQSHYDEASGLSTLVLTGFVPQGRGRYRRFREVHVERAYPEAKVRALLEAAGLRLEAVYDCFTSQPAHSRSLREMYVARRPA